MGTKEHKQSLSAVLLCSILGMGLYAAPALAAPVTVTGNITNVNGNEDTGTPRGNQVIVKDASQADPYTPIRINGGSVAGTDTSVSNNSVTVTNSTLNAEIYGGAGGTINEENVVSIDDKSSLNSVWGGIGTTANHNRVESAGTISNSIYGGQGSSEASDNTIIASGGSADYLVGGLASGTSASAAVAKNNKIEVSAGNYNYVHGAQGGILENNTVTISGGNIRVMVAGGMANQIGSLSNNKVILTGGTIGNADSNAIVAGGYYGNYDGSVTSNSVEMSGTAVVNGTVYGGLSFAGSNVKGNSVKISAGSVSKDVIGGYTDGYGSYSQDVTGNSVELSGTAAVSGNVYGGKVEANYNGSLAGAAIQNTVKISDVTLPGEVYGGYTAYGDATGNAVTLDSGTFQNNVFGGTAVKGNASGNTVKVSGATVTGVIYGANIGEHNENSGFTGTGDVTGNAVTIESGTINNNVYGGNTPSGDATDNSVTLEGGTIGASDAKNTIYGGYAAGGNAVSNTVTIKGGDLTSDIYGGYSSGSEAELSNPADNNTVTLLSGNVTGSIIGGESTRNSASGNTVTIDTTGTGKLTSVTGGIGLTGVKDNKVIFNGGTTESLIGGNTVGSSDGTFGSINNTVEMNGGTSTRTFGGVSGVSATNNTVIITGGDAGITIGAMVTGDNVSGNKVILSGGTAGTTQQGIPFGVTGGYTMGGDAASNTVTISGGEVSGNVIGGYAATYNDEKSGNANSNTVNFSGGTLDTGIYGGESEGGAADDNTVNILGGTLNPEMDLYGGYSELESTGNTLNFYTKDQTVKNLDYFQTLNFYVPAGTVPGETMLEVTNTADVAGAAVNGGIDDSVKLSPGQVINLLHDANTINTTGTTYSMITGKDVVTDPGFVQHKVLIKEQDPNTIVLYIPAGDKGFLNPDTKLIPEQREAAISELVNASDLAATQGYASAVAAYEAAWLEDHSVEAKFIPYAVVGGHDLRYDTGSYVDSQGLNTELGFVKRTFDGNHADTIMPFAEYGNGNYTSHLDSGARSDGDQHYLGAGRLLRRDLRSGLHYEGMLRAGYLSGDFRGLLAGHRASYDTGSQYIAAHLGLGKIISKGQDDFDYYGKFYWTHLGSDTTRIYSSLGSGDYHLDSVNSYRTRLGLRWTRHLGTQNTIYAGLGWDYEFDGEARAQYREFSTPAPSVQGSSGMLELGWQSKATRENPWGADLRITGWTGAQRGVTYGVTVSRRL